MTPKELRSQAERLFSQRGSLMSLWQEIAEQFYVERADFTAVRTIGDDWAGNLSTSFTLLCRRDLGDQIGEMLRPTNKTWAHMRPKDTRIDDNESKRWLQWAEDTQRRAMYDLSSQFARATKTADHDFAAFGQAPMSVELSRNRDSLLYRCWHLKDVVWMEDQDGKICFVARKWKVAVWDLPRYFPKATLDPKIAERAQKNPFDEILVMHIVCGSELWDGDARGKARVSIFYDCEYERVIEETPIRGRYYIIPRWSTVSGSQYAFSPATVAALPEGRLLQSMTLTLLEAGEKAVNPPLIATKDVVKSDMQQFPGGVTWVDQDYDERLGEALRAMNIDVKGLPISLEMVKDSRAVLERCFFLNKLKAFNPNTDPQMTAFQAGQIVQEYIRGALPLFEPMEIEYNGALCEETFELMYANGGFGSPQDMPTALKNVDIEFHFESPLHDAIEAQKGTKFLEFKQILAEAIALDPSVVHLADIQVTVRDVADGIQVPAKWLRSEGDVQDATDNAAAATQQQQTLANLQQGAEITKNLGSARKDMATAAATAGP